jgi:DNA polymerase III delta' subunit
MALLQWKKLIGQERIKEVLSSAFSSDTLGHAYLFCGDNGVGTFAAALDIAMALHCSATEKRPCCHCSACKKILNYSHPDLHVVMPLALQKEQKGSDGKITDAAWDEIALQVRQRIDNPYLIPEYATVPSIPVEWIREISHAIRRGAVLKGKNIVIIDGIDTMQPESANAMLKTLEEPPAGTLLILCTSRPHTVLPTIVSRCQLLRFSALNPDILRQELIQRFSITATDQRLNECIYTGSLGRAYQLFEEADTGDTHSELELLRLIAAHDMNALFEKIDQLSALGDYSLYEKMFIRTMYEIRNAFLSKIGDTENYIMGANGLSEIFGMITTPQAAEILTQCCETAISRIRSRANIALVLINFAFSVMEFFNEQKQQNN